MVLTSLHIGWIESPPYFYTVLETGQYVAEKCYKMFKCDFPTKIKVYPIVSIPHKSKEFRQIPDLSFSLKFIPHGSVLSLNKNSEKTAPGGLIDQKGHVLLRLICAFSEAPDCANIFQEKWDIKEGFWRIDCKEGEECNVCYVLPQNPDMPIKLAVPTSLKMGWIEPPPHSCTVSETGRDLA